MMACFRTVSTLTDSTADCPFSCSNADAWCADIFGRGGSVHSAQCYPGSSFRCICNEGTWIDIHVNQSTGRCDWNETFQSSPSGGSCLKSTGVCPKLADCASNASFFSDQCRNGQMSCAAGAEANGSAAFKMSCFTCSGGSYSIISSQGSCTMVATAPAVPCDPVSRCSGHGCCLSPEEPAFVDSQCTCFGDPTNGYWSGAYCNSCDAQHTSVFSGCTQTKSQVQILLTTLGASPTAMILPNLMVLVIFVLFGLVRRQWTSDEESDMCVRREAGLNPLPASMQQHGLNFRPRALVKRPSQSRGFMNQIEMKRQDTLRRGPSSA